MKALDLIRALQVSGVDDGAILKAVIVAEEEHRARERARVAKYRNNKEDRTVPRVNTVPRVPHARVDDSSSSKEGTGKKEVKNNSPSARDELETVLDPEHAAAVVEHRQRKRNPMTPRAAKALAAKFAKTPDPNAAADTMMARGWTGFEPEWLEPQRPNGPGPPPKPMNMSAKMVELLRKKEGMTMMDENEIRRSLTTLFAQFGMADGDPMAKMAGYIIALEDASPRALEAAVRAYLRGVVEGHDGRFAPTSAELARVVRKEQDYFDRMAPRPRLIAAPPEPPEPEPSAEERAKAAEKTARILAKFKAFSAGAGSSQFLKWGDDEKPKVSWMDKPLVEEVMVAPSPQLLALEKRRKEHPDDAA